MYGTVIYPVVMYSNLMANFYSERQMLGKSCWSTDLKKKKKRQVEIVVP